MCSYSFRQWIWYLCLFMKQNCHFDRDLVQYKHSSLPMSFLGINTTLLGFPKRCITLVYLKRLKSYQPSKFKRVDFLSLYLVHAVSDYKKRVEFQTSRFLIFSRFYAVFVSYFSEVIQFPFLKFWGIWHSRFLIFFDDFSKSLKTYNFCQI